MWNLYYLKKRATPDGYDVITEHYPDEAGCNARRHTLQNSDPTGDTYMNFLNAQTQYGG